MEITVERRAGAVWLTLNRPGAMNALSRGLVAELHAAVRALADEAPAARALVVTGAGDKAFCAGADLKERRGMSPDDTRAFLGELNATLNALAEFPAPVVAAINGVAFGGGLELALACDLRVVVDRAELGLLEARLGIIPGGGGTQRLPRLIGVAAAKELILTGRRITPARALALGLVSQVAAPGALGAAVDGLLAEIGACGPLALAQAKRALDGGVGLPLDAGLALERDCYEVVLGSEDRVEGLAAFAEKRPPVYQGK